MIPSVQWGWAASGGAWNNNRRNARCAYRNRNVPDNFNNNLGFRLFSHDPMDTASKTCPVFRQDAAPN
jgi:hypothetical protein